jgi:hypothetical protein
MTRTPKGFRPPRLKRGALPIRLCLHIRILFFSLLTTPAILNPDHKDICLSLPQAFPIADSNN